MFNVQGKFFDINIELGTLNFLIIIHQLIISHKKAAEIHSAASLLKTKRREIR